LPGWPQKSSRSLCPVVKHAAMLLLRFPARA